MASADLIRSKVQDFLGDHLNLDDFEDWFLANNWNAHLDSDDETVALVHRVEGLLLDFSAEAINEEVMRKELANAVRPFDSKERGYRFRVVFVKTKPLGISRRETPGYKVVKAQPRPVSYEETLYKVQRSNPWKLRAVG